MRLRTLEARQVRVGDYIFNNLASDPAFRWCRVVCVDPVNVPRSFDPKDGSYPAIEISTSGWVTYKHPREGLAVKRL